MTERKKIAAVITEYFANSHADVIVPKFVIGFPTDEGFIPPRVDIVSLYIDQVTECDVGHKFAAEYGIPIYPSIVKTLTLGGDTLAVGGVLRVVT